MSVDATKTVVERVIGVGVLVLALLAPLLVSDFWMDTVLTQTFILGIGAASLVFLSAYGGMISLAQAGLMGIAGYALGNMVSQRVPGGETKGLTLGWDPTLAVVLAILLAVGIGLLFGAVASRSFGIYFLMLTLTYSVIAYLFVSQVTQVGRLLADRRHRRGTHRDSSATSSTTGNGSTTSPSAWPSPRTC